MFEYMWIPLSRFAGLKIQVKFQRCLTRVPWVQQVSDLVSLWPSLPLSVQVDVVNRRNSWTGWKVQLISSHHFLALIDLSLVEAWKERWENVHTLSVAVTLGLDPSQDGFPWHKGCLPVIPATGRLLCFIKCFEFLRPHVLYKC